MIELEQPSAYQTACDLMCSDLKTLSPGLELSDAMDQMARWGVRGAPVLDGAGHCIGILSVSDIARSAGSLAEPRLQTCPFMGIEREPGGRETVLCLLPLGVCANQRNREMRSGRLALTCAEPDSLPTDWQVVESAVPATATVRDFMSTTIVSVQTDTPIRDIARLMMNRGVHRVVVFDADLWAVGVVSVDDLLQIVAHPQITVNPAA